MSQFTRSGGDLPAQATLLRNLRANQRTPACPMCAGPRSIITTTDGREGRYCPRCEDFEEQPVPAPALPLGDGPRCDVCDAPLTTPEEIATMLCGNCDLFTVPPTEAQIAQEVTRAEQTVRQLRPLPADSPHRPAPDPNEQQYQALIRQPDGKEECYLLRARSLSAAAIQMGATVATFYPDGSRVVALGEFPEWDYSQWLTARQILREDR
jgi:hypothetical protein